MLIFCVPNSIRQKITGVCMSKVCSAQIRDRKFPENIIKNRRRHLDSVISCHHARRLKSREGKSINEFFKGNAILKTNRNGHGKAVHQASESCAFLVHINENFSNATIFIFSCSQINLMPSHSCFLGIAFATFR